MTQEEKEKVYIELINRLKDVKEAIKKQNYGIAMNVLCKPYPEFQITTSTELAESEDEMIRNFLIKQANSVLDSITDDDEEVPAWKSALAWLEKQGNNMGISEATKQELEDNLNKALEKETPESCNEFLDEQSCKEEKLKEHNICDTCEDSNGCLIPCCAKLLEKQGEQKPKFRVGDIIKCKYDDRQFTIKSVDLDKGTYTYTQEGCGNDIDYADEEFELVEQKPADKYEPMSLDEAIKHCREKSCGNNACALEHKQLEKWLTELKKLKG